jgi:hypothetical protein
MEDEPKEVEEVQQEPDYTFDMAAFPKNTIHQWVDRGEVISCEGATHRPHRHFKRKPV